ncbi:MAG: ATP-binding cassette domain-containing protein [Pseudomonadota bacterium]
MLFLKSASLRRGPRLLLDEVSMDVFPGQKVGLVGANGCGKSSLFALIGGRLDLDAGSLSLPASTRISEVAQETAATDRTALDHVLDGDHVLRNVQQRLAAAEADGDGERIAKLNGELDDAGAWDASARAARLLRGLGFSPQDEQRTVREFSGGWRVRLNLAQALMCPADLMLLDEPTNHLDLDAVLWLEDWLKAWPGTLLLVSHDREFLDAVTDITAHIEHQKITLYKGNYSQFERLRAAHLEQQRSVYERQQREMKHMQSFVDRFRYKASKARQAQSRLKAMERLQASIPAHADSPFSFTVRAPDKMPRPLLGLDEAVAGYGDKTVLDNVSFAITPGQRIGLLGPNGAGKSTLIKSLAGEKALLSGNRSPAAELNIGYFAQHQMEQLSPDDTPLQLFTRLDQSLASNSTEQRLRDVLGGFGFGGDRVAEPVAPLSGGEKARLVLALVCWRAPNLLLLDEPTNHLDLEMRHALTMALQEYPGAVVLVSHDRHLLRTVCDSLLLVHGGGVDEYRGDLDDYARWLAERREPGQQRDTNQTGDNSAAARKALKREQAQRRSQLAPLKRKAERLEAMMNQLHDEHGSIESQLSSPELYEDDARDRLKQLLVEQAQVQKKLEDTEQQWLSAAEELDRAQEAS